MNIEKTAPEIETPTPKLKAYFKLSEIQKRYLWRAFWLAVSIRFILLLLGYMADRGMMEHTFPIWDQTIDAIYRHWDARHYLILAEYGYAFKGDNNYIFAFFPLYPYLVKGMAYLIPHYILAALMVSFLASVAVGYLLQDLMRLEGYDEDTITKAFLFCFFFPTAIHAALPFSEALFLALVLYAFRAARQQHWLGASLAGILACATRLNGLILLPALAVDAFYLEKKAAFKQAFWLLFIPLGLGLYLFINWYYLGEPFAFVEIQKVHWNHEAVTPWRQVNFTLGQILYTDPSKNRLVFYETRIVAIVLGLGLLLWGIKSIRPSWQVYCWLNYLLFMTAKNAISFPRYLWVLFPLFIILARLSDRPLRFHILLSSSTLLMAAWFMLYAAGKGGV